jgi:hypothetical protein
MHYAIGFRVERERAHHWTIGIYCTALALPARAASAVQLRRRLLWCTTGVPFRNAPTRARSGPAASRR